MVKKKLINLLNQIRFVILKYFNGKNVIYNIIKEEEEEKEETTVR